MQIPIENIYFLLCYAWNKLEEKNQVAVSVDGITKLPDLFAKILINSTKILLKRGIDKNYNSRIEEMAGIKGKIAVSETLKRNLLAKQHTVCSFDELSINTLPNRILVTTIFKLIKFAELDNALKSELIKLYRMLSNIELIDISDSLFLKTRLNRNNRFYGFALNVCKIIHEYILPSEKPGEYNFADFTRDERKMNQLFEEFIRNFYTIEQKKYPVVKREIIHWNFDSIIEANLMFLPQMKTDITLENDSIKIIIDTKYYRETMVVNYGKEIIKPENLYQLFSYLLNQQDGTMKTQNATGILLYPTIENEYNLNYTFNQHQILIRTVNLNSPWENISERLLEILNF